MLTVVENAMAGITSDQIFYEKARERQDMLQAIASSTSTGGGGGSTGPSASSARPASMPVPIPIPRGRDEFLTVDVRLGDHLRDLEKASSLLRLSASAASLSPLLGAAPPKPFATSRAADHRARPAAPPVQATTGGSRGPVQWQ